MSKIKNLISLFVIGMFATAAYPQQKAEILVSYDCATKDWRNDTTTMSRMSLLANSREAKFFNDISLWNDSLSSTPEGKKKLHEILMAQCVIKTPDGGIVVDLRRGPTKKIHTFIFSDTEKESLRYYSKLGDEDIYYDEPFDEQKWEIVDSTANVLGYECLSAETVYHGRKWKVLFTPEIPVPFGPWKLHGLPGLILKAEADNGNGYVATGIEKTDRVMTPMYSPDIYGRKDRKKALSDHEYYLNNLGSIVKARTGGNVRVEFNDQKVLKYDPIKYSDEPDYKTGGK